MCTVVYLSTDVELELRKKRWISVEAVKPDDPNLPTPPLIGRNTYYIGSDLGCGCNFLATDNKEDDWLLSLELVDFYVDLWEPETRESCVNSTTALVHLIRSCLTTTDLVELWVTWDHDQSAPVRQFDIRLADIDIRRFFIAEGRRYTIQR